MPTRVIVSIDDRHLPQIQDVARQLTSAGLQIDQILDGLGMITGEIEESRRSLAGQVPGVAAIETEGGVDIGPPGSVVS
jgi:hypothetical protein